MTRTFSVGVNWYQTVALRPAQSGSSTAVVASVVLIASVNGSGSVTIVALSKSSLAGGGGSSIWQVEEHPSPSAVLPSSHSSLGSSTPLPHRIGTSPSLRATIYGAPEVPSGA